MRRIFAFFLITATIVICTGYLFSKETVTVEKGEKAGTISKSKGSREITVQYPGSIASKIKIGSKLYAVAEKDGAPVIIELEVTFPMMTQAKVRAGKNSELLTDKMPVYLKAEIVAVQEMETLPPDDETSLSFRKNFSESMVQDTISKTEGDCPETILPGNFFLKPDFSEPWKHYSCTSLKLTDKNSSSMTLNILNVPVRKIINICEGAFNTAVNNYKKSLASDPAKLPSSDETEKALFGNTFILPESGAMFLYNRDVMDKVAKTIYPRDGWFGIYPAQTVYRQYSVYLRYFARIAVHLDKNKTLHNSLTSLQKKALTQSVYMKDAMTPMLRKGGIPEFNISGKDISWQIVSYYTRREHDGTLKVFLKYFWRAFKDFDQEFYKQPDIRAFEAKIMKM